MLALFRKTKPESRHPIPEAAAEILSPERCLNCGATVTGKFCPECGQEHSHKAVSIWHLLSDFLEGVFSWDSKLFRTLGRLLFLPGLLTEEYNRGRRARYLSPFRLYLYASALMFYLMTLQVNTMALVTNPRKEPSAASRATVGESLTISGRHRAAPRTAAEYDAEQARLPPEQRDPALVRLMVRKVVAMRDQRLVDVARRQAQAALGNAPKAMFLLLPAFAFLLKLIYIRRGRLYIEHLVFALHCHAFVFMLLSIALAFGALGYHRPGFVAPAIAIGTWLYILLAMKRVYRQGWVKTVAKMGLLAGGYAALVGCVTAGVLLYTFLTA